MAWELRFMEWGGEWWSSPFLDHVIPWITHLGSHVALLLFLIVSSLIIRRKKVILRLLLLYGIESGVLYGLKFLLQRPRPFHFLAAASKLSHGPGEILDPSFPSGHTVYAFMMATLLAYWFPRYRVLFFILAVFVGWTRIYLNLHYPTDVIAGGLLGYGITKIYLHIIPPPFAPPRVDEN
jgi:undecaprenyl-diphosphatase